MLNDIKISPNTTSRNKAPNISVSEKLAEIEAKTTMRPRHLRQLGYVSFGLPYVDGITVEFSDDETAMSINHFNIGDSELTGRGIGSRLLLRAVKYGLECYPKLDKLVHASANLALVNTVVKVVGEEYVAITNRGEHYGFGTEKPLESMFDDTPYVDGLPYMVDHVEATLDRQVLGDKLGLRL